ncbi:type I secretion system permease/ATPase [Pseudovibrio sp. Ad26]|uniref:type I secretion system permease/ATPase n=1 Tax=Pseudovibrio sp. Ad26 TaxID=989410 RepID=UPI0007AE909F|nr:type I secretion system permease/ATPase [Pseudovibrio sp. Ad26]KZL16362.1 Type I secretion system ATP-binding protein PrsD [Pseudovibrio sp. Ad26]
MPGSQRQTESVITNAFRSLRSALLGIGGVSMLLNILMLTGPLFMLQVYDRVLASGSVPTLVVLATLVGVLFIFYGILETLRSRVLSRLGQRVDAQLSGVSYEISTSLPLILGPKGAKMRPVQDLDQVRSFLSGPGPAAIFDLPWMPLYFGIVYLFHPYLGMLAIGGALVICALVGVNEFTSRKPSSEAASETNRRSAIVEASRSNAEVIQAMGMMETMKNRWHKGNDAYLVKQRKAGDRAAFFATAVKTFRFILQSAMLGMGAWLVIQQEVTSGVMIASSIMSSRALAPVEQAVSQWKGFLAARQGLARLRKVIENKDDTGQVMELPLPHQKIDLDGVACGPVGIRQPIVQGISFTLAAGEGLGVIGKSGSGKSTLSRSIVGITNALTGSIRFDGSELDQWTSERIGEFVGFLPQDIQLFDGTVAENISRFKEDVNPDDVIEAAKIASIHEFITGLPDGYNTIIGSGGYALSGGQRQRIALARAMYGEPFLIVLDEPNSNLDSEGEACLTHAIKLMRGRGKIVIVIAHRPSAIAAVNKVLVLNDGRQAAFGPRDEVMKQLVTPVQTQQVPQKAAIKAPAKRGAA